MKRFLITLAALAAASVAQAADLAALKAPAIAQPRLVPVCGNGGYFGINTEGSAGAVNSSSLPNGGDILQGELGVTIGYTGTIGTCVPGVANPFWFIEARFNFTNLSGGTTTSPLGTLALSGPLHFQQRIGYGNPAISQMLSSIPGFGGFSTPSLPVLPNGVTAQTSVPYLYAAVNEQDVSSQFAMPSGLVFATNKVWEVSPEIGIGMWTRLSNSVVVDVHAGYQIQVSGACLGPIPGAGSPCPGFGNKATAGVSFNF